MHEKMFSSVPISLLTLCVIVKGRIMKPSIRAIFSTQEYFSPQYLVLFVQLTFYFRPPLKGISTFGLPKQSCNFLVCIFSGAGYLSFPSYGRRREEILLQLRNQHSCYIYILNPEFHHLLSTFVAFHRFCHSFGN